MGKDIVQIMKEASDKVDELKTQFGSSAKFVVLEVIDSLKPLSDSKEFSNSFPFWMAVLRKFRKEEK